MCCSLILFRCRHENGFGFPPKKLINALVTNRFQGQLTSVSTLLCVIFFQALHQPQKNAQKGRNGKADKIYIFFSKLVSNVLLNVVLCHRLSLPFREHTCGMWYFWCQSDTTSKGKHLVTLHPPILLNVTLFQEHNTLDPPTVINKQEQKVAQHFRKKATNA